VARGSQFKLKIRMNYRIWDIEYGIWGGRLDMGVD